MQYLNSLKQIKIISPPGDRRLVDRGDDRRMNRTTRAFCEQIRKLGDVEVEYPETLRIPTRSGFIHKVTTWTK